jgi:hypothetical protein
MRTDRQKDKQTDRQITKLIDAFRNFANAPNKDVLALEKETARSRPEIPAGPLTVKQVAQPFDRISAATAISEPTNMDSSSLVARQMMACVSS